VQRVDHQSKAVTVTLTLLALAIIGFHALQARADTTLETFDRWFTPTWPGPFSQDQNCSLGKDTPLTPQEKAGAFSDNRHPVLQPDAETLKKASLLRSEGCDSGALLDAWKQGVSDGLGGQRFLNILSGTAGGVFGDGRFGLTDVSRQACRFRPPESELTEPERMKRQCCIQGYLAAIPELNRKLRMLPPDPDPERLPEEKSCRDAYDYGQLHARVACAHAVCVIPKEPCIPVRHLGCFHLGFTTVWTAGNCEKAPKEIGGIADLLNGRIDTGRNEKDHTHSMGDHPGLEIPGIGVPSSRGAK
jgi:hypothetical protein